MPLGDRGGRVQSERGGEGQGSVYGAPEMKWIIECGINTANKLGSPPPPLPSFEKKEKLERLK